MYIYRLNRATIPTELFFIHAHKDSQSTTIPLRQPIPILKLGLLVCVLYLSTKMVAKVTKLYPNGMEGQNFHFIYQHMTSMLARGQQNLWRSTNFFKMLVCMLSGISKTFAINFPYFQSLLIFLR